MAMDEARPEIDLTSIKDEIVVAAIVQLQSTGNRPHVVKELAAALSQTVKMVESYVLRSHHRCARLLTTHRSANPSAIISSRLAAFLKRTWSSQAPCPVAKELEPMHPRRTFFYLTTCPRQAMPESSGSFPARQIISPSLSSAASRSDEAEAERRRELSPSPEIDLSGPEFENDLVEPISPVGSFSGRSEPLRHHRAASPPLEKDEREFTQTARGMQKRQLSGGDAGTLSVPSEMGESSAKPLEHESLFDDGRSLHVLNSSAFGSSPAMRPTLAISTNKRPLDDGQDIWSSIDSAVVWDMRSPEVVALDELDALFDF